MDDATRATISKIKNAFILLDSFWGDFLCIAIVIITINKKKDKYTY